MDNKERLKQEIKSASDISFYAMQRIDLLVISVSGAGIYGCWDVVKFLKDKDVCYNACILQISASLFLATIIFNFIGQWCSYKCHTISEYISECKLNELEYNTPDHYKNEIIEKECVSKIYNKIVKITNSISLISLFIALILFSVFIFRWV